MKKISFILLIILSLFIISCGEHVHEFKNGYCECGLVEPAQDHTHVFGEWVVVKDATVDEVGSKERICECGAKETETIEKLVHTHAYGEWVIVKEATEEEAGLKERVCLCGEKETEEIVKLEHIHNFIEGKCVCGETTEVLVETIKIAGKVEMNEGEEQTLVLSVLPEYATNKEVVWSSSDDSVATVENGLVKAIKAGIVTIKASSQDGSNKETLIEIKVNYIPEFYVEDMDLFIGESKELNINIISGNIDDIRIEIEGTKVEYNDNIFTGVKIGETEVRISIKEITKTIYINVKPIAIKVLNESLEVDVFDKLELDIDYPKYLNYTLEFEVLNKEVFDIKDNTIIPNTNGTGKLKIYFKEDESIRRTITVKVTTDPIEVIKKLHIEEPLMKKKVTTFGSTKIDQSVMGSVSRYYFGSLNLIENIVPITDNDYVGVTATKEILNELDETGKPRTGVKLEEIKYITYHDTGNNTAGANAEMHARYMVGDYNKTTRARSWHYTVDSNCVIHHVPDDEVTWQGDAYTAYSQSIGIETCVDSGSNLHLVWQRMGKLCAQLITKYDLSINSIKQHYDWNQKNCPQTLRMNNLYSYAISLVEGELMVKRALNGYKIKFESLSPEYVNNEGVIIKAPLSDIKVGYKVTITDNNGYNESIELYSNLKPLA